MTVVAVAGATGHLGRTIVEVLKSTTNYDVVALGRKAREDSNMLVNVTVVDYSDVKGTAELLESKNVDTIISTISVMDQRASEAQVNLIKAASESSTVKRFITSDWGVLHTEDSHAYPLREAAVSELRKTDLEWTRFVNGYFIDYYAIPHIKSYLTPFAFAVDVANKAAAIPGTGNEPISFTYTFDLAKFVASFLGLQKWDEITYCCGDTSTWNDVVKYAEEARGVKFTVTYDSLEKLQKGEITELPSHVYAYDFFPKPALQGILAIFGRWVIAGRFEVPTNKALNVKFPEIETMKVKDVLALWKGH